MSTTLTVVRGLWVREAPLALDGVDEPRFWFWPFRILLLAARGETGRETISQNPDNFVKNKPCTVDSVVGVQGYSSGIKLGWLDFDLVVPLSAHLPW